VPISIKLNTTLDGLEEMEELRNYEEEKKRKEGLGIREQAISY
jgi:hypothetical protein